MQNSSSLLIVLVVVLQVADAYLTWRLLSAGGRELNPIVRIVIDYLGLALGLVVAKVVVAVMAVVFIFERPLALLLVAALYTWVVIHNWRQLATKRGAT
jgi:hypothetical protein